MEQVAKLKGTWNLAPVPQIAQKVPENYYPHLYYQLAYFDLYLSIKFGNEMWFRRYISKLHSVAYTNAHHDVTDIGKEWDG